MNIEKKRIIYHSCILRPSSAAIILASLIESIERELNFTVLGDSNVPDLFL